MENKQTIGARTVWSTLPRGCVNLEAIPTHPNRRRSHFTDSIAKIRCSKIIENGQNWWRQRKQCQEKNNWADARGSRFTKAKKRLRCEIDFHAFLPNSTSEGPAPSLQLREPRIGAGSSCKEWINERGREWAWRGGDPWMQSEKVLFWNRRLRRAGQFEIRNLYDDVERVVLIPHLISRDNHTLIKAWLLVVSGTLTTPKDEFSNW